MDHQTFQVATVIFGLMVSVIGTLGMRLLNTQQADIRDLKHKNDNLNQQITTLALDVARNYMPRDELESKLDAIFVKLDEIQKEVRHA